MSESSPPPSRTLFRRVLALSGLEKLLLFLAFIAILAALLIPPTKWASSGELKVPVHVLIFDAATQQPLPEATVILFRSSPWYDDEDFLKSLGDHSPKDPEEPFWAPVRGITDARGQVIIPFGFKTGANYERPEPYARPNYVWTRIAAKDYGGAIVQVWPHSVATKELKQQKQIRLAVGLLKASP